MKREIKFRGLTKDGVWVCGDLIHTPENTKRIIWFELKGELPLDVDYNSFNELVVLESVGQFTGLTDKNGVEIYEGDIVKCWDNCAVEKWSKYHIGTIVYKGLKFTLSINKNYLDDFYNAENIEIIGNIHQNPELL